MKKQKLVSDFITLAGGIFKSFEGAKDYSKLKLKDKISVVMEDMNFVKKADLAEMKEMIIKFRGEIDALKKKLSDIEKKFNKKK